MTKKLKKEAKEPEKKEEVIPEVTRAEIPPSGVNIEKITEILGQIKDVKEWIRISAQYDLHRTSGAQLLLEKLENELKSYK